MVIDGGWVDGPTNRMQDGRLLGELERTQRSLLSNAVEALLCPANPLAEVWYMTCSILQQEDEVSTQARRQAATAERGTTGCDCAAYAAAAGACGVCVGWQGMVSWSKSVLGLEEAAPQLMMKVLPGEAGPDFDGGFAACLRRATPSTTDDDEDEEEEDE